MRIMDWYSYISCIILWELDLDVNGPPWSSTMMALGYNDTLLGVSNFQLSLGGFLNRTSQE